MTLLAADTNVNITVLDSLLVLLLGMLVIFLVLTILIFVVKGYVGFFALISGKKNEKKAEKKVEKKVEQVVPVVAPVANVTSDEETVATIMAAITAYYMSESASGEVPPFRVKSIILK